MHLYSLKDNVKFKVVQITQSGEVAKRMAEMGITSGTSGYVIRKAPLGGPVQVRILNYDLSLRKDEAESVVVERVG